MNKVEWTLKTLNPVGRNTVPAGYTAGSTSDAVIFKSTNL